MTQKIEAVIFDCDGTLVDSETLGGRAMYETAAKYGCTLDEPTLVQACLGSNMQMSIDLMNQHSSVLMPECFAEEARALMTQKFQQELVEIAGAKALLNELTQRGIPFAMATNGPRAKAELTLGITGLLPYFQRRPLHGAHPDVLISAYEHNAFKPLPELFLIAAAALGVTPTACAAVEDSASGIKAGLAAHMHTFSITPLAQFQDNFVPAPTELPRLLSLLDYL
jgi:beta-phosphoglucomutase-like phosphatase (HAD superfamily)